MLGVYELSTLFCLTPQVGFEPTILRLTASRLLHKNKRLRFVINGLPRNRLPFPTRHYSHFLSGPAKEIAKVKFDPARVSYASRVIRAMGIEPRCGAEIS
jgi:hypothetical protein